MIDDMEQRKERIISIRDTFISLMWMLQRGFSQRLQHFGLTKSQFITLNSLVAHQQACPMRDLTEVTFQDAPTMTGVVNRLIKMGLVKRTRSTIDRRVVLVQATTAGQELVQQIEAEMMEADLQGYSALSDEELNALEALIEFIFHMYMRRYIIEEGVDEVALLEKLKLFKRDPIYYAKLHNEKLHLNGGLCGDILKNGQSKPNPTDAVVTVKN